MVLEFGKALFVVLLLALYSVFHEQHQRYILLTKYHDSIFAPLLL